MIIDSHAHLNFPELEETEKVLARAKDVGVETIINIGTSIADSQLGIEIASKFPNVYTTVGIHPNDSVNSTVESIDWKQFEDLAKLPKVVAIGECGLDYSRFTQTKTDDRSYLFEETEKERLRQKRLFRKQIEIAQKLQLPLSIHVRDAYDDMITLAGNIQTNAVFHCFSGTPKYLNSLLQLQLKLKLNFYFSFAGNITFKNAESIRDLAKLVPLDRILVETDCPFLAPEPHRGSRNVPANVRIVAEKLAEVREINFEEIAKITTANSRKLFQL